MIFFCQLENKKPIFRGLHIFVEAIELKLFCTQFEQKESYVAIDVNTEYLSVFGWRVNSSNKQQSSGWKGSNVHHFFLIWVSDWEVSAFFYLYFKVIFWFLALDFFYLLQVLSFVTNNIKFLQIKLTTLPLVLWTVLFLVEEVHSYLFLWLFIIWIYLFAYKHHSPIYIGSKSKVFLLILDKIWSILKISNYNYLIKI